MASPEKFSSMQIPRLRGSENYEDWTFAMEAYLSHEDLWGTIHSIDGAVLVTAAAKVRKARSKIILALDPRIYSFVRGTVGAQDAWKALEAAFKNRGASRKCALLERFATLRLVDCVSPEDYVDQKLKLAHSLTDAGLEPPDEWIGISLLAGLPPEYEPMKQALSNSVDEITADLAKNRILTEVKMQGTRDEPSGYAVRTSGHPTRGRGFSSGRRDRKFGINNNFGNSRDFYNNDDAYQNKDDRQCYECGREGHLARNCLKRKRNNNNRNKCGNFYKNNKRANFANNNNFIDDDEEDDVVTCSAYFCSIATENREAEKYWIIDSGASRHMCADFNCFQGIRPSKVKYITVANMQRLAVKGRGDILLNVESKHGGMELKNVLFVPGLSLHLISVSCLTKSSLNYEVTFKRLTCEVVDSNQNIYAIADIIVNGMYRLRMNAGMNEYESKNLANAVCLSQQLWHRRLGHMNHVQMSQLKNGAASGIDFKVEGNLQCRECVLGKKCKDPFYPSESRAKTLLKLVHSDLCEITSCISKGGFRYILTFLDDHSRMTFVHFLKRKSDTFDAFKKFKNWAECQTGLKIGTLRTDRGTEYINEKMYQLMEDSGIRHETSVPDNPSSNGRAERVSRTLVERVRCMLFDSGLNQGFWAELVATVAHLMNLTPKIVLGKKTPWEIWYGEKPDISRLRVFGCKAFAYIPKKERSKLDPKAIEYRMLGYAADRRAYRLYEPKSGKIIIC